MDSLSTSFNATWGIRDFVFWIIQARLCCWISHYAIVTIALPFSYQNQFVTSVNYHTSVILLRKPNNMLSNTQKLKYPSSVTRLAVSLESINPAMQTIYDFIRNFAKTSYSNVSIYYYQSPYRWVYIEHERHTITSKIWLLLYIFFLWSQSTFDVKNAFTW